MKKKEMILRYSAFFAIIILSLSVVIAARGARVETREVRLYFVDAEMLRLVPVKMTIPAADMQQTAGRVLNELIKGRDDNPKIRRIIPNIKRCMTVKVENETATVDIKEEMVQNHPDGRDLELLTVYSIVNSITDIDGISVVKFTIEGEVRRKFMGYLDMRETFVPDFFI